MLFCPHTPTLVLLQYLFGHWAHAPDFFKRRVFSRLAQLGQQPNNTVWEKEREWKVRRKRSRKFKKKRQKRNNQLELPAERNMRISQMLMRAVCMYCILRLRYYTNAHAYRGTNGSTSLGLSTNLHMLITTVAALRFSCIAPRLVRDLPLVEQNGWFVDRWEQNDGCYHGEMVGEGQWKGNAKLRKKTMEECGSGGWSDGESGGQNKSGVAVILMVMVRCKQHR